MTADKYLWLHTRDLWPAFSCYLVTLCLYKNVSLVPLTIKTGDDGTFIPIGKKKAEKSLIKWSVLVTYVYWVSVGEVNFTCMHYTRST